MLPQTARADDLPHLTPDDPTAKALNYTEDATKVDAANSNAAPAVVLELQFLLRRRTGYGPCQLFAGKAVNAKGWCSGYAKKA